MAGVSALRCALSVSMLALGGGVVPSCAPQLAAPCFSACRGLEGCEASCDSDLRRCVCERPPTAVLSTDGRCQVLQRSKNTCTAEWRIAMAVMAPPSPEFGAAHVRDQQIPESVVSAVLWGLSEGLKCHPTDIMLAGIRLIPPGERDDELEETLITCQLVFEICAFRSGLEPKLDSGLQPRFVTGLRRFAMFAFPAEVQIAYFEALSTTESPPLIEDERLGEGVEDDESETLRTMVLVLVVLCAAVGIATAAFFCYRWRQKRMYYQQTSPDVADVMTPVNQKIGVLQEMSPGAGAKGGQLVVATVGFEPAEVGATASSESSVDCLALNIGDIVEVLGSGGGWHYGRHCTSGFFGYFPENRVIFPDPPLEVEEVLSDEVGGDASPPQPPQPSVSPPPVSALAA